MAPNHRTNGTNPRSPALAGLATAENPAAQLLRLWQDGSPPDLDAFLAESGDLPSTQLAAVLRVDQRERWRFGQRVPAETYLQRYPRVCDDEEGTADLVYGEYLLREQQGAAPPIEEFLWRFPNLASILLPQIELHQALQATSTQKADTATAEAVSDAETRASEGAPRRGSKGPVVPGYKILGELGRGGMGVVYKALHVQLKRTVALKMLLAGVHAGVRELVRFRTEAEAAARLRHPNIVQVYEVGECEGRPYLVLEFLDGGSLKNFLTGVPRPARWSAELLRTLARAVHHAHRQGVVHRDLKPANIMLFAGEMARLRRGDEDSSSLPADPTSSRPHNLKITDFGLAKQLGDQASGKDETRTGDILGTPSYMAPEQATGKAGEVGPATDVYALGSILYELITGRPPFQGDTPFSTLQQVATEEPVSPSQLQRKLPIDLVTICLKCLQKEPRKRYATAEALADDLGRFLAYKPILARPVGATERLWRSTRRNPVVAGLVAALVLSTVGALALMTGLYLHAREQATRAIQAEKDALAAATDEKKARETAQARDGETTAVLGFVENQILAAVRPKGQGGGIDRDVALHQAIEAALPFVDKSFANKPLIEARLRMILGTSFWFRGEAKMASEQYYKARTLYTRHLGLDHSDTLWSMHNLANSYTDLGRHAEALQLREETLARRKATLGHDHLDTLLTMHNLAVSYNTLNRHTEAFQLLEETLARQKAKLGTDHLDTLWSMLNLACSYAALGRHDEALQLRLEASRLRKAKLGFDHPDTLRGMNDLAASYADLGRHQDAFELRAETLALRQATLGPDHPDTLWSMYNLACSYDALGRPAEALQLHEETAERRIAKLGPYHPDTLLSTNTRTNSYLANGGPERYQDVLQLHEETLARRRVAHGPDHADTLLSMKILAGNYVAHGRHREAVELLEEKLTLEKAKLGPDHAEALWSMDFLASSYHALRRFEDSHRLYAEMLARRRATLGDDHAETILSMKVLATSCTSLGLHRDAIMLREELLMLHKVKFGPDAEETLWSMHSLALGYASGDRHQDAIPLFEETLARRKAVFGRDHFYTHQSMKLLADSYSTVGRHLDALNLLEDKLPMDRDIAKLDSAETLRAMWDVAAVLVELDRGAEAVSIIDECVERATGKRVNPHMIPRVMNLRLRHFESAGDVDGCRETAEMWEKLNRTDADSLCNAAVMRAATATVIRATGKSAAAGKQADAEDDHAMAWLKQAVAAGYKNGAQLKVNKAFDTLRDRPEFKQVLANLEK